MILYKTLKSEGDGGKLSISFSTGATLRVPINISKTIDDESNDNSPICDDTALDDINNEHFMIIKIVNTTKIHVIIIIIISSL